MTGLSSGILEFNKAKGFSADFHRIALFNYSNFRNAFRSPYVPLLRVLCYPLFLHPSCLINGLGRISVPHPAPSFNTLNFQKWAKRSSTYPLHWSKVGENRSQTMALKMPRSGEPLVAFPSLSTFLLQSRVFIRSQILPPMAYAYVNPSFVFGVSKKGRFYM